MRDSVSGAPSRGAPFPRPLTVRRSFDRTELLQDCYLTAHINSRAAPFLRSLVRHASRLRAPYPLLAHTRSRRRAELLTSSVGTMHATTAVRTACQAANAAARAASTRSPIVWTYLPGQVPYERGLLLQESLVQARLSAKAALQAAEASEWEPDRVESLKRVADTDILLLLQHTPVFTAGRREKDPEQLEQEGARLRALGADYIHTMRGGQTTYHGPGQLVGYSLMDIGAAQVRVKLHLISVCLVR